MKRNLLLIFLLVALIGCLQAVKKFDFYSEMDGFRDQKWGTYVEDAGDNMVNEGFDERKNVEWFSKKDDPLQIGKANVEGINYVFRDGRLAAISIIAHGESNYRALREEMEEALGTTQSANENTLTWDLPKTSVLFSYNNLSEIAMLVIRAKDY